MVRRHPRPAHVTKIVTARDYETSTTGRVPHPSPFKGADLLSNGPGVCQVPQVPPTETGSKVRGPSGGEPTMSQSATIC